MPLYEFKCDECGYETEEFLISVSDSFGDCTECENGVLLKKLSFASSIINHSMEATQKEIKRDADRLSSKIKQMDPAALEDVYGSQKASEIWAGKEKATDVLPKKPVKYKELEKKFNKNNSKKPSVKRKPNITKKNGT